MLAARAPETVQRVARHVVAALHRNLLDRVRHVLDRDLDETIGNQLGRAAVADLFCQRAEGLAYRLGIEREVLVRAEYLRKQVRDELADHDVGVGERERPAAAIT